MNRTSRIEEPNKRNSLHKVGMSVASFVKAFESKVAVKQQDQPPKIVVQDSSNKDLPPSPVSAVDRAPSTTAKDAASTTSSSKSQYRKSAQMRKAMRYSYQDPTVWAPMETLRRTSKGHEVPEVTPSQINNGAPPARPMRPRQHSRSNSSPQHTLTPEAAVAKRSAPPPLPARQSMEFKPVVEDDRFESAAVIKCRVKGQIIKCKVPVQNSRPHPDETVLLNQIMEKLAVKLDTSLVEMEQLNMSYTDEDGDNIVICTDEDFLLALGAAKAKKATMEISLI